MAKFEEEKVINALHPEKAEVGKKYWFEDSIAFLKSSVESFDHDNIFVLEKIIYGNYPFRIGNLNYQFLYPYEEPPKQKMTYRQLAEWFAKGNGQWKWKDNSQYHTNYSYTETNDNKEVDENYYIRPFGQTEWIEPTVDIYERDCKGGKE